MNLAKEGLEFVSVAIGTSRTCIKANEDIVRRVVRAYAGGIQVFKADKGASLRMIEKQLKVADPEIRENTYAQFRDYLKYPPYVSRKGMETVIAEFAVKEPEAKKLKPEDILDMRFVAELEKKSYRADDPGTLRPRKSISAFWRGGRSIPTSSSNGGAYRSARI